jgi:divalent metal cation (Fe/Co/Zn/Cd) transporter
MDTRPITSVVIGADECCADSGPTAQSTAAVRAAPNRAALIRRAFRLEYATVAWMVIEASVTIWAAFEAASVSLLAFGVDSLIELASAGVLLWRLTVELHRGQKFAEGAERTASRIAGGLLFALAAYVMSAAGWRIWTQTGGSFSWPGLIITTLAMPVMYVLARQKIEVAEALGSRAMRADAMESVTCGWLSAVVIVGLIVQGLTGAWWVDSLTSLAIVWLLLKEGREAWTDDNCCCD